MSALIRDLGVVNRDCSDLDLIFLKFISWLLFCRSRIAICFHQHFKQWKGEKTVKMYFLELFVACVLLMSSVLPFSPGFC